MLRLFGMPASDYKRFLNFLAAHDCNVDFRAYRSGMAPAGPRGRRGCCRRSAIGPRRRAMRRREVRSRMGRRISSEAIRGLVLRQARRRSFD